MCRSNHLPDVTFSPPAFCTPKVGAKTGGCPDPGFAGWIQSRISEYNVLMKYAALAFDSNFKSWLCPSLCEFIQIT